MSCRARSPTAWPCRSLSRLKRSASSIRTLKASRIAQPGPTSTSRAAIQARRLSTPVREDESESHGEQRDADLIRIQSPTLSFEAQPSYGHGQQQCGRDELAHERADQRRAKKGGPPSRALRAPRRLPKPRGRAAGRPTRDDSSEENSHRSTPTDKPVTTSSTFSPASAATSTPKPRANVRRAVRCAHKSPAPKAPKFSAVRGFMATYSGTADFISSIRKPHPISTLTATRMRTAATARERRSAAIAYCSPDYTGPLASTLGTSFSMGRRISKRAPRVGLSTKPAVPPCVSAMWRMSARPSP